MEARRAGVEQLEATNREAGWRRMEYRQLTSGPIRTRGSVRRLGGLSVLLEASDQSVEGAGEASKSAVHMVLSATPDRLSLNGSWIDENGFGLYTPRSEASCIARKNAAACTIEAPLDLFVGHHRALAPGQPLPANGKVVLGAARANTMRRLRSLVNATWSSSSCASADEELTSSIVSGLVQALLEGSEPDAPAVRDQDGRHRVLAAARDYIEANLAGVIRMSDVCTASGTSLRTLERVFRRELETTPIAYIRLRRLDAVRRTLASPHGRGQSIARIAIDHGFRHLGRFAATYRKQFGELPSRMRELTSLG